MYYKEKQTQRVTQQQVFQKNILKNEHAKHNRRKVKKLRSIRNVVQQIDDYIVYR